MQAAGFLPAIMFLILGAPALAHHSFPADFDKSRQGELTGRIVGAWYKNPHARYRMEVTAADGTVAEWDIQTTSVTSLRKIGWGPDTLTVGETVRVWGDLGHGDSKKPFMRVMEKGGKEYFPFGPVRQMRLSLPRQDSLEVFEPAPCDPDGYFRDLLETGRLEQHLGQ